MDQQFNYWLSVRNSGSNLRNLIIIFALLASGALYGQGQPAPEKIKADVVSVQNAVNDVVGSTVPFLGILQGAKGAYLDGYGIVLNVEVAFDPPVTPFSSPRSPEEVRKTATKKRADVQDKLTNVVKEKLPSLSSLAPGDSVAVILNILNTNPAYTPDMPAQIVLSAKKQDAEHVAVREFK
jgi:hypothetical protein